MSIIGDRKSVVRFISGVPQCSHARDLRIEARRYIAEWPASSVTIRYSYELSRVRKLEIGFFGADHQKDPAIRTNTDSIAMVLSVITALALDQRSDPGRSKCQMSTR